LLGEGSSGVDSTGADRGAGASMSRVRDVSVAQL
jgi:hypothetical protein